MGKNTKLGLVMEGGSMRGMFTAGVTDVMMENGIEFDGAIGVSAGATFGCNYKSKQIGRALRYNVKYCKDKRYCSFRNLLKEGNLFSNEFCYKKLPNELDVFDTKTFTVDGEEVTNAFTFDSDGDWTNDTNEGIVDGYYHESEYISAPSFALRIDGITELN